MSSSRPKLKLDEQSFQDMLAAAFTIQEHNAKRKQTLQPQHLCGRCGAPVQEGEPLCRRCAGEELRPGEQMQRKWASLWLMSQELGLGQERSPEEREQAIHETSFLGFPDAVEIPDPMEEAPSSANEEAENEWPGAALADLRQSARPHALAPDAESTPAERSDADASPARWTLRDLNLRDLRLKLRFHRADLYLVLSIIVSTFAMLWVLSATPAPGAQRKPRLRPWERALISMGLADAPEPPPRRGNPNISVWVDPKTALYYCAGEDLYGKALGGHVTTQREAQMDQFEPAGRAACE